MQLPAPLDFAVNICTFNSTAFLYCILLQIMITCWANSIFTNQEVSSRLLSHHQTRGRPHPYPYNCTEYIFLPGPGVRVSQTEPRTVALSPESRRMKAKLRLFSYQTEQRKHSMGSHHSETEKRMDCDSSRALRYADSALSVCGQSDSALCIFRCFRLAV